MSFAFAPKSHKDRFAASVVMALFVCLNVFLSDYPPEHLSQELSVQVSRISKDGLRNRKG